MSRSTSTSFDSVEDNDDSSLARPSWASPTEYSTDGGKLGNLRSLECSSINIEIVETEMTGGHMSYVVMVESGISTWTVNRRYNDFIFLPKLFV